jgi:hypothetical protein
MSIRTKATSTTTGFAIIVVVVAALFGITTIVTGVGLHVLNFAFAQQKQQPQTFTAKLSGSNEVPPVTTSATGMAQFQLTADGSQINYKLNATNLNNFMMAHIHQGKAGENGPPVVPLSMGSGKITASDLQGPLAGKQLSDLINLMKTGGTYANIHTQTNQNGEIRGQISP